MSVKLKFPNAIKNPYHVFIPSLTLHDLLGADMAMLKFNRISLPIEKCLGIHAMPYPIHGYGLLGVLR